MLNFCGLFRSISSPSRSCLSFRWSPRPGRRSLLLLTTFFFRDFTGIRVFYSKNLLSFLSLRAFYIVNWYYRYTHEGFIDKIAVVSGCVQTVLYMDFFYLYITKGTVDSNHKTYLNEGPSILIKFIFNLKTNIKCCTGSVWPSLEDLKASERRMATC